MSQSTLPLFTTGEGPTLLFIHGLGSSRRCWDQVVNQLSQQFHCCTLDLPGHGTNRENQEHATIEDTARELANTLDGVRWTPEAIVGHSMGGLIAASLAESKPDAAHRLVLLDTPTRQLRIPFLRKWVVSTLKKNRKEAITRQYRRMTRDQELAKELIAEAMATNHYAYDQYMESLLNADYRQKIHRSAIPVHVWMTRSLAPDLASFHRALEKYGYRHLPEEQRHHDPDWGHFLMMESPQTFLERVKKIVETPPNPIHLPKT